LSFVSQDVFDALGLRYVPPKQRNCYQTFDIESFTAAAAQPSEEDEFDGSHLLCSSIPSQV
jgi:hypothetical protein